MESPFVDFDYKRHLSVNVDTGLWQCFKSGRKGNFITLFSNLEDMSYFRAQKELMLHNFEHLNFTEEEQQKIKNKKTLELDTSKLIEININSADSDNKKIQNAWSYVWSRGLFDTTKEEVAPFYLCLEGKFANRLLIPFRKDGIVFFFQARSLEGQNPKYLNPSTEYAPNASDLLYPFDEDASSVVVCESPLDARALQLQGVNATATMKNYISPIQAEILSIFKGDIILGFDNDDAGKRGVESFEKSRKQLCLPEFYICYPPNPYKDWNEAHLSELSLKSWVESTKQKYNFEYIISKEISLL